jgi:hypothetical protein
MNFTAGIFDPYALTVSTAAIFMVLALSTLLLWSLSYFDVEAAYLEAVLLSPVFCHLKVQAEIVQEDQVPGICRMSDWEYPEEYYNQDRVNQSPEIRITRLQKQFPYLQMSLSNYFCKYSGKCDVDQFQIFTAHYMKDFPTFCKILLKEGLG